MSDEITKTYPVIVGGRGVQPGTTSWDNITDKPDFATVATSGSYNDLTDTPTIVTPVQSDWNESDNTSLAYIANKPSIPAATTVTDGDPTLAWSTRSTVATINGTDIHVTMPAAPSSTQETIEVPGATPSITVQANKVYNCTGNVTSLTVSSVENSVEETNLYFTTASTGCTLTLPNTLSQVFGSTTLKASTAYAIAFKDNRAVIVSPDSNEVTVVNNNPTLAYGSAATVGSVNGTNLTLTMPAAPTTSVTDNNPTLSWGTQSKVATVAGTDIHVTMPSQPTFTQVQSDWNEADTTSAAFIVNKPSIPAAANDSIITVKGGDANSNVTFGSFTTDQNSNSTLYIAKMGGADGTAAGSMGIVPAPAATDNTKFLKGDGTWATPSFTQTQANWNESDSTSPAFIQNKPTIPAAQVQTDWNASTGMGVLLNKPTNLVYGSNNTSYTIWAGTQAEYDLLTPDAHTVYFILEPQA